MSMTSEGMRPKRTTGATEPAEAGTTNGEEPTDVRILKLLELEAEAEGYKPGEPGMGHFKRGYLRAHLERCKEEQWDAGAEADMMYRLLMVQRLVKAEAGTTSSKKGGRGV